MSNIKFGDNWEIDKLNRKDEAIFLTNYLIGKSTLPSNELNNGSFVLNVNAAWGFGKTYFLRNWVDDLYEKNHPVVYFDAWENDFSKEPLIAFISSINAQLEPYFNKKIGENRGARVKHLLGDWYRTGKKLVSPSSPFLLSILAKKLAGMSIEEIGELFEDEPSEQSLDKEKSGTNDLKNEVENTVSTVVSKAASSLLANHNTTKKTIHDFKESLERLTNHLSNLKSINTPIFIFVDELDRCRPNYAIELLECIKHLFGVPGVYFIVSTASEQLVHSIKKIYGNNFDSSNYLKRFFDQTYNLKEPNRRDYAEYLFSHHNLANRENLFSPLDQKLYEEKNINTEAFAFISDSLNIGLRDMIQYCIIIDSVCLTFKEAPIHLIYIVFLAWLKDTKKDLYDRIAGGEPLDTSEIRRLTPKIHNPITTYQPTNSFNKTRSTTNAYEIITRYIDLTKQDITHINKRVGENNPQKDIFTSIDISLMNEMRNSYPNNSKQNHCLSIYPKLIEQAGRIS